MIACPAPPPLSKGLLVIIGPANGWDTHHVLEGMVLQEVTTELRGDQIGTPAAPIDEAVYLDLLSVFLPSISSMGGVVEAPGPVPDVDAAAVPRVLELAVIYLAVLVQNPCTVPQLEKLAAGKPNLGHCPARGVCAHTFINSSMESLDVVLNFLRGPSELSLFAPGFCNSFSCGLSCGRLFWSHSPRAHALSVARGDLRAQKWLVRIRVFTIWGRGNSRLVGGGLQPPNVNQILE